MKIEANVPFHQPEANAYGCAVNTAKVLELAEQGVLDWETIAREALQYMSEDDVADMASSCGWLD